MKPDSYIPFYGNDFFGAIAGHSDATSIAYLRAIWHYWHHEHCKGLRDDDEFLRKICAVDRDDWPAIRDVIFDNGKFFMQDGDGFWHQKRAQEEWEKSQLSYEKAVKGGKNRWKNVPQSQRKAIARRGGIASAKVRATSQRTSPPTR